MSLSSSQIDQRPLLIICLGYLHNLFLFVTLQEETVHTKFIQKLKKKIFP